MPKRKYYKRLRPYSRPKIWLILGMLASCAHGCFFPVLGIYIAKILFAMMNPNLDDMKSHVDRWCLWIFITGIGLFVVSFTKNSSYGTIGENITLNMR